SRAGTGHLTPSTRRQPNRGRGGDGAVQCIVYVVTRPFSKFKPRGPTNTQAQHLHRNPSYAIAGTADKALEERLVHPPNARGRPAVPCRPGLRRLRRATRAPARAHWRRPGRALSELGGGP